MVLFDIAKALGVTIGDLLGQIEPGKVDVKELTKGMKEAIKMYPVLESVKDDMPNWAYRGKYPSDPAGWYTIYTILKIGKSADE